MSHLSIEIEEALTKRLKGLLFLTGALVLTAPGQLDAQESSQPITRVSTGSMASPPDLSGTWAQLQVQASVSSVPVVGEIRSQTRSLSLVSIRQDDRDLEVSVEACSIDINSDLEIVRTIIPDAMVAAVGTRTVKARLKPGNTYWRYEQQRDTSVLGAKLKDAENDSLPEWSRDFRVYDHDRDGNPGVTVNVDGMVSGSMYLVQRSSTKLRGIVKSRTKLEGMVTWNTEQNILGATSKLLKKSPEITPDPKLARSFFRMKRISSPTSCDALAEQAETLFPD